MGASSEILRALETRLATVPGLPDIAWPNIAYAPDPATLFLRPNNLPTKPTPIGVADVDDVRRDGFFQVDVFAPKGKGSKVGMDMAEEVNTLFAKGTEITTASGYVIKVRSVAIEEGRTLGAHFAIPVLIQYIAVTP